jgi:hypothetical protein
MVLDIQSDKVLAANCGFLSARHLQDIRKVARIARSEGISLTVHGVVVGGQDNLHLQKYESSTGTNSTAKKHDGRGSPPTKSVGDACEKPTAKQQRSARRLEQYKAAKRADVCNARWLRLATPLLRQTRAKLRGDVWTAHMRAKLALRAKMGALFHRVWSQRALVVQPDAEVMAPWPSTPQLSEKKAAATPAAAMCATSTAAMCATPAGAATPRTTRASAQQASVFGPEDFGADEADYDAEEQRQIEAAIAASLADAPTAESPPDDPGANRARRAPPSKGGKKPHGRGSSRPLQPANRG